MEKIGGEITEKKITKKNRKEKMKQTKIVTESKTVDNKYNRKKNIPGEETEINENKTNKTKIHLKKIIITT